MENDKLDIIRPDEAGTLAGLFLERVKRSPRAPAYRSYDQVSGTWQDTDWQVMSNSIGRWQAALAREGLQRGDRVAVMLRNCREWVIFDQAALGLGLVTVPLYTEDRADNTAFIIQDSGSRLLLVGDDETWARLAPACGRIEALARVVVIRSQGGSGDPRVRPLEHWLPPSAGEMQAVKVDPKGLASIVYTSGTTGRPKGVMLSHNNMLENAYSGLQAIPIRTDDLFLSFLPLSHTLERTIGYYLPLMSGATVAFARSIPELAEDLISVRPTVMVSVPRIYERVYAKIQTQLQEKPAPARALFSQAVEVGWSRFEHRQGRGPARPGHLLWPILDKLVAGKVLAKLGGRMRLAICGGAALSPGVARLFIGLGLPLLQGYGLTESSPVISCNLPDDNVPASIGLPLPGVEVRIGEQDELLARGPNVMLGYWHNPEATEAVLESDGWLHTGDKARIEGRHIFITGRIKDILVLATGEKVPPADMEMAIAMDPLFEQVMVIGEAQPYLAALVVLNPDLWQSTAEQAGLPAEARNDVNHEAAERLLLERIAERLKDFPGYARVHHVAASLEPWTVESGLITPTMKVKRSRLLDRFSDQVVRLYAGHGT